MIVAVGEAVGDDVGISVSAVVGVKIVGVDVGAGVGVWVGDAVAMDGVVDGEGMDSTVALGGSVLGTAVLRPKNTRSTQPSENAKNEQHACSGESTPQWSSEMAYLGYGYSYAYRTIWVDRVYSRRTPSEHSTVP